MKKLVPFYPLLKESLAHFKGDIRPLAILALCASIPDFLSTILELLPKSFATELTSLILAIISLILYIWFTSALILRINDSTSSLEDAFYQGWKKFFSTSWVLILMLLTVIVGFIFFFIPGIIFGIYINFALFFLILDNKKGISALLASKNHLQGKWWAICGRLALLGITLMIPLALLTVIEYYILSHIEMIWLYLIIEFILLFVVIMGEILVYIFNYYLYKDLKVKQ